MTEDPKVLIMKINRKQIMMMTDKTVTIKIDDWEPFLEKILAAIGHPNMWVASKEDTE